MFFTAMPQKNHCWFHKEPFSQRFFKEPALSYLFIIWRTFFCHKEPFVKQKGSSDDKGSLWNHLDKKMHSMASWRTLIIFKSVLLPSPQLIFMATPLMPIQGLVNMFFKMATTLPKLYNHDHASEVLIRVDKHVSDVKWELEMLLLQLTEIHL